MSVITRTLSEDGMQLFCKGAPEKIASLCQPDTGKTSALDKKDGLPNLQTIGGGWVGGWGGGPFFYTNCRALNSANTVNLLYTGLLSPSQSAYFSRSNYRKHSALICLCLVENKLHCLIVLYSLFQSHMNSMTSFIVTQFKVTGSLHWLTKRWIPSWHGIKLKEYLGKKDTDWMLYNFNKSTCISCFYMRRLLKVYWDIVYTVYPTF